VKQVTVISLLAFLCALSLLLTGTAVSAAQAPESEPAPTGHLHLSPDLIQAMYLKGLQLETQKAARVAERADCLLSMWYSSEGYIQAVQLIKSSGNAIIDQACLQVVIGRQLTDLPAFAREHGGWTQFPIHWLFVPTQEEHAPPVGRDPSIPALARGSAMHLLPPYYPDAALEARAHGICKMHVVVSEAGHVDAVEIMQSTHSEALDKACQGTIRDASFVPAKRNGEAVSGTADVVLDWRLPAAFRDATTTR
jgi:TonB family protein